MTASDELMDAFPGFSTYYHKKRDRFEQKKLIIIKEGKFFGVITSKRVLSKYLG